MTNYPHNPRSSSDFFNIALGFEGGLIVVAYVLARLLDIDLFSNLLPGWQAVYWGILGTVPLFLMFLLFYRYPIGPLYPIKRSLIDILGPLLAHCRWYNLILLAALAGISEELLFRGVLQPWLELKGGMAIGLIGSNVVFGLLHWITPTYALIAGLIGIYLGLMLDITEPRNLLTPIIIHGVYDYLAFLVVARSYRLESRNQ